MSNNYPKIVQIIPAENLWARYRNEDDNTLFDWKIVCYALMEDKDGDRYIAPMEMAPGDGTIEEWETSDGFLEFIHKNS